MFRDEIKPPAITTWIINFSVIGIGEEKALNNPNRQKSGTGPETHVGIHSEYVALFRNDDLCLKIMVDTESEIDFGTNWKE